MPEPLFGRGSLKAIVFDLDGTLYRQDSLRRAMLLRLLRAYAMRPLSGLQTFRVLGAYRRAQESLRASTSANGAPSDLAEAQIALTCERTKADPAYVTTSVIRWMEQEPLALLARYLQTGLVDFLHACKARGLRLGVLSDYPADAKLEALGLNGFFDVVLTAQSPDIGVFKPHPRGLLLAAERLGASGSECLYVGDRADVDGAAALAAGMACCIVDRRQDVRSPESWMQVASFPQLQALVLGPVDSRALNRT